MKQLNWRVSQISAVVLALMILLLLRGQTQQIDARSNLVRKFDNGVFVGSVAESGDTFLSAKFWLVTEKPVECLRLDIRNSGGKSIGVLPCDNLFTPDKDNADRYGKTSPHGISVWFNGTAGTDFRDKTMGKPVVALQSIPRLGYVDLGYQQKAESTTYLRGDETPASLVIVYTMQVGKDELTEQSVTLAKIKSWQESKGEGDLPDFSFDANTMSALQIGLRTDCLGRDCGKRPVAK